MASSTCCAFVQLIVCHCEVNNVAVMSHKAKKSKLHLGVDMNLVMGSKFGMFNEF